MGGPGFIGQVAMNGALFNEAKGSALWDAMSGSEPSFKHCKEEVMSLGLLAQGGGPAAQTAQDAITALFDPLLDSSGQRSRFLSCRKRVTVSQRPYDPG